MNFKSIIVLLTASLILFFSTLISWYEGAQILDDPLEWDYTAIFSNWINGEVTIGKDIVVFDYFIYAAKFSPVFPLLMVISLVVIMFQIFFLLFKNNQKILKIFFVVITFVFGIIALMLFNSYTMGLKIFSLFFGVLSIVSCIYFCVNLLKKSN